MFFYEVSILNTPLDNLTYQSDDDLKNRFTCGGIFTT